MCGQADDPSQHDAPYVVARVGKSIEWRLDGVYIDGVRVEDEEQAALMTENAKTIIGPELWKLAEEAARRGPHPKVEHFYEELIHGREEPGASEAGEIGRGRDQGRDHQA